MSYNRSSCIYRSFRKYCKIHRHLVHYWCINMIHLHIPDKMFHLHYISCKKGIASYIDEELSFHLLLLWLLACLVQLLFRLYPLEFQAYFLAKLLHPDQVRAEKDAEGGSANASSAVIEKAINAFKAVSLAYETILKETGAGRE